MSAAAGIASDLRSHVTVCEELLRLVQRESQALNSPDDFSSSDFYQHRKALLPRLEQSAAQLKKIRLIWQNLPPADRTQNPEVPKLLRTGQDLTMKILMIDRENEQMLLRRGLVPAKSLPPAQRQRPHYVAELYRRSSGH
jgi:hypothetical protein